MQALKQLIVHSLRDIANKIDAGTCELNSTEAAELLEVISHISMSKESACMHLNISRSRFDDLVREGKIPKGKKCIGFKELRWYKDELDKVKNNR